MNIHEILHIKLQELYQEHGDLLIRIGDFLEPELWPIVDTFYAELMEIPEIEPILKNAIVQKNLKSSLRTWIHNFFQPHTAEQIQTIIERQKKIGSVHANLNINLNYFTHGISLLKREIHLRIHQHFQTEQDFSSAFLVVGQLFDVLVSVISEAYFLNEMIHETNELSLKMKGMNQNAAIECERLRSSLLDWLRTTLTFLYQAPELNIHNLPKLQYSSFGLWVIYKADLMSYSMDVSADLKKHIHAIDDKLFQAAGARTEQDEAKFFETVTALNDAVSKTSWFISTIVDQVIELDTGMDTLTRLFNRRYLDTILRRQTDISMKQGLPFTLLMLDLDHFKEVNDTYGHESGDAVLKQFAELLLMSVRSSDFIFRFGGEEFLIVLSNVGQPEALNIAEKIRQRCEEHVFQLPVQEQLRKTCSIGIASYSGHPDFNNIIQQADAALYDAKELGRNQTRLARTGNS